jgi:hypothetical protein
MTFYRHSTMESYYGDMTTVDIGPCQVRIDDGRIEVFYQDEDGGEEMVYEGHEVSEGHFDLTKRKYKGKGTLHCFSGDKILDGWWSEGGDEGMWRIHLSDESPA